MVETITPVVHGGRRGRWAQFLVAARRGGDGGGRAVRRRARRGGGAARGAVGSGGRGVRRRDRRGVPRAGGRRAAGTGAAAPPAGARLVAHLLPVRPGVVPLRRRARGRLPHVPVARHARGGVGGGARERTTPRRRGVPRVLRSGSRPQRARRGALANARGGVPARRAARGLGVPGGMEAHARDRAGGRRRRLRRGRGLARRRHPKPGSWPPPSSRPRSARRASPSSPTGVRGGEPWPRIGCRLRWSARHAAWSRSSSSGSRRCRSSASRRRPGWSRSPCSGCSRSRSSWLAPASDGGSSAGASERPRSATTGRCSRATPALALVAAIAWRDGVDLPVGASLGMPVRRGPAARGARGARPGPLGLGRRARRGGRSARGGTMRRLVPALGVAAVVIVIALALPAGATHTNQTDPNDTAGRLDVRTVTLAHDETPRWRIGTFSAWTARRIWDRGFLIVELDTIGDDGVDQLIVVRSDGRRADRHPLSGSGGRERARHRDGRCRPGRSERCRGLGGAAAAGDRPRPDVVPVVGDDELRRARLPADVPRPRARRGHDRAAPSGRDALADASPTPTPSPTPSPSPSAR